MRIRNYRVSVNTRAIKAIVKIIAVAGILYGIGYVAVEYTAFADPSRSPTVASWPDPFVYFIAGTGIPFYAAVLIVGLTGALRFTKNVFFEIEKVSEDE